MKDFNILKPWGMMARCIVNPDGSIAYFLDEDNSNLKSDGTEIDWVEVEAKGQNVMVQIPKCYSCKKQIDDAFYFGISDQPVDTDYIKADEWTIDYAFYRDRTKMCDDKNANPVEVDYRYIGAFHGWVDSKNRLRSLPNKTPTVNETIGNFRNYAKNMGLGYTQLDYYLLRLIQMLYITEYGHPDSQTHIGRGFVDENSAKTNTGGTLDKGNNTFGETTGKKQMSYRGIEDFYGNVYNWVDGICTDSNYNILINNKGFNDSGLGYTTIIKTGINNSILGNIRKILPDTEAGFIIQSGGGSYESDGLYDYGYLRSGRVALFGGDWDDGSSAGAFQLRLYDSPSSAMRIVGARLCF